MKSRTAVNARRDIVLRAAMGAFAITGSAWAQAPETAPLAPPATLAASQPATPPTVATSTEQASAKTGQSTTAELPASVPPPAPPVAVAGAATGGAPGPAEASTAPPMAAAPAEAPPAPWYSSLKISAFADAYYSLNANNPHPTSGTNTAVLVPGGNGGRAYDFNNGFSMHWAGIDAVYAGGNFGATVGLRFGPSTAGYNYFDSANGMQFVKQAFATWKPFGPDGKLTIDIGKYDQPFGSEVADSQLNVNYTRTFLYWLGQPLHFTGLRVDYAASDQFDIKFFVANGWNRVAANNTGLGHVAQNLGTQVMLKPVPEAVFMLGYMVGANQDDVTPGSAGPPVVAPAYDGDAKTRLRHFVDFVADVSPISVLRFLFNADYGTEEMAPGSPRGKWYGANLVVGIKPHEQFFIAPRGEVYVEDHWINFGAQKTTLTDETLTFGYVPTQNFLLKLDLRADQASQPVFPSSLIDTSKKSQFTATLGVVATTN